MFDHTTAFPDDAPDQLVPDSQVQKEFSVCAMTMDRWDKHPKMAELGWDSGLNLKSLQRIRRQLPTITIAGVLYVKNKAARQILAEPKQRRGRR